jgi:hypothetical protein
MLMNKTRFPLGSLIATQPYEDQVTNNHVCQAHAAVSVGGAGKRSSDGFHPHWRKEDARKASELSHDE